MINSDEWTFIWEFLILNRFFIGEVFRLGILGTKKKLNSFVKSSLQPYLKVVLILWQNTFG